MREGTHRTETPHHGLYDSGLEAAVRRARRVAAGDLPPPVFPGCPHERGVTEGQLCDECRALGAAVVHLTGAEPTDGDPHGLVEFSAPPTQGLSTEEMRYLLGPDAADRALSERKQADARELEEAGMEPYDADPDGAEYDAYGGELASTVNELLTHLVDDRWGTADLLVLPLHQGGPWVTELMRCTPEHVRTVIARQGVSRGTKRPGGIAQPLIFPAYALEDNEEDDLDR